MGRGGARNRSGPPPDPKSGRSEKLGVRFGRLPRGGFTGRVPAWPLTTKASTAERTVWNQVWRTPQAAAWATEPWRHPTVAMYVQTRVRFEAEGAAALGTIMVRLADQIGMTPAGLRENGWEIEQAPGGADQDEPAAPAAAKPRATRAAASKPLKARLQVVRSAGG